MEHCKQVVSILDNGNVVINNNKNNFFHLSANNIEHAKYFQTLRPNSQIVKFDVPTWFNDLIEQSAIPQKGARTNPASNNGLAPRIVDPRQPGKAYEFPSVWTIGLMKT
jgi:hypothetical protein